MINPLDENQINKVLKDQYIGRLGCVSNEKVYVVPIRYVYDGNSIYAHTNEGLKLTLMRNNPNVCFEVDDLKDPCNWKSVIAIGLFEEIKDENERKKAVKLLLNKNIPFISSIINQFGSDWPFINDITAIDGVVFKIILNEKTGKYESSDANMITIG